MRVFREKTHTHAQHTQKLTATDTHICLSRPRRRRGTRMLRDHSPPSSAELRAFPAARGAPVPPRPLEAQRPARNKFVEVPLPPSLSNLPAGGSYPAPLRALGWPGRALLHSPPAARPRQGQPAAAACAPRPLPMAQVQLSLMALCLLPDASFCSFRRISSILPPPGSSRSRGGRGADAEEQRAVRAAERCRGCPRRGRAYAGTERGTSLPPRRG